MGITARRIGREVRLAPDEKIVDWTSETEARG